MRLFIAINFDGQIKSSIDNIIKNIEKYANQGRFVKKEHLHLTLEFLGEISEERVEDITSAMEVLNSAPFTLFLSSIGFFKGRDGHIYWFGITENNDLMNMQEKLHNLLLERGFKLENRKYKPHITIGRKVRLVNTFDLGELEESIKEIQIPVNSIELMKSERIDGKLVYTELFSKSLNGTSH
ncbi:MAG: RNA 2',3'-cyclic phosphodiesterase [Peptococcaceae bacterium]|nr:RNA 2',3'-cyclic phosphodiesterase [Peptococcaceae bacterium]